MSKKVSSKALQADYSIKPNELAFLVREYLKSIGCNNALAAFMSEHPEASKVQAPTNKRLLTLKNILDKYLEMKAREEQMEHLIKELSETNSVLVKLVSHLQAPAPIAAPDVLHPMTSSSDSQLQYSGFLDSRAAVASNASSTEFSSSYISTTSSHPNSHTNGHQNGHINGMEQQDGQPQAEFMESAVRQLMEDPSFAASLAQQLNAVRDDRTRTGDSFTSNNDSVYEQVLESDTIGNILDQLIPYQAGTPAATEDGYTEDAYSNDSRLSQSVQTPHTPHTPYGVVPNASSSTGHIVDDLQLMYPEMQSFDAEESNAGSSFSGLGRSTAIPMSYFEQHPNGLELLQSQPKGAGSAPVLTSLAQGTKSNSSLLGSSTRLPGINFKTVPSSRPKTPNASEASRNTSPPQKTKKRIGGSPEGLAAKKKKER